MQTSRTGAVVIGTHTHVYTAELTMWVLGAGDRLSRWQPWDRFGDLFASEVIHSCADMEAVLAAQGRLAARLMETLTARFRGFRLVARAEGTGALAGVTEWRLSTETRLYRPAEGMPWTACEYGEHGGGIGHGPL